MGTPNYLILPVRCQSCGGECKNPIQFNYGVQADRDYSLGDEIDWAGRSNCGRRGLKKVIVAGSGYACPICNKLPLGESSGIYAIQIENDRIVGADVNNGTYDFSKIDWIVLEE